MRTILALPKTIKKPEKKVAQHSYRKLITYIIGLTYISTVENYKKNNGKVFIYTRKIKILYIYIQDTLYPFKKNMTPLLILNIHIPEIYFKR